MAIKNYLAQILKIDTGYKRLWYVFTIVWIIFATYFFGYAAYNDLTKKDKRECTYVQGVGRIVGSTPSVGIYGSIFKVPFSKLYICKLEYKKAKYGGHYFYYLDGPRYITLGRLFIILFAPLIVPLTYIIVLWVKDGFKEK